MYKTAVILLAGAFLTACSQKSLNYDIKPGFKLEANKTCAVLPFANLTTNVSASDAITTFFTTEVRRINVCNVIEKSETDVKAKAFDKPKLMDAKQACEIGKKLGVDYIFTGGVTEYSYQYGLREDPAVGFSAKMINVANGEVVWSADEGVVGSSVVFRNSLDATAIDGVKSLLSTLK